ncbi:MAG: U5 small nuclear ribonucleoprotein [Marteilia pararefringens]
MTRHSKHSTALPFYSKNERIRDSIEGRYGTQNMRISSESLRQFDCCSLTLQKCVNPVISRFGDIFEKESIYRYILDMKSKIKQNEVSERKKEAFRISKKSDEELCNKIETFQETNKIFKIQKSKNQLHNENLSFWKKGMDIKEEKEKYATQVLCPIQSKPISTSMLYEVKFSKKMVKNKEELVCSLTQDTLTNSTSLVYLKPSKSIITLKAYETLVKKDMIDPISNTKLNKGDTIFVSKGASSFSGSGNNLKSTSTNASLTIA